LRNISVNTPSLYSATSSLQIVNQKTIGFSRAIQFAYVTRQDFRNMAAQTSSLLDLPDELLLAVAEAAAASEDAPALRALARTCHRTQSFAEAFIYRSILVRSGSQASSLADALSARSLRADYIFTLDLRIRYRKEVGMELITPWIAKMTELRTWVVESPWCNYGHYNSDPESRWQREIESFATVFQRAVVRPSPRPLPMLRSCESPILSCA